MVTGRPRATVRAVDDVWVSWSGGKDAAAALVAARAAGLRVTGLLSTQTATGAGTPGIPVHGVPHALVAAQADALGLPLHTVTLPVPCSNEEYLAHVRAGLAGADGVSRLVGGDIALADVRAFREAVLEGTGIAGYFPLWGRDTAELAAETIDAGLRAVVVAVDPARVPAGLVGRPFDAAFLAELPAAVDPCGENGEFHTFVTGGPGFAREVPLTITGTVERDGHVQAVPAPRSPDTPG
ncbi:MJ0570-related uncharacterized domain-containing protein [Pseudonocardia ammonioxydans]|uniref:MJ0570-related uncharacterized domain-containing protein n=1 Tax=Pseudonocardia ammonioxydans TaxID=260086 RepID=A0A1I4W4V2_PSUAM|nr:MJ0570-related uncharacterized domain-containing protein [Pseudonocardia ammonioxydans]